MVSARIHPNGTKYKSHPIPKISIEGARETISEWPVMNKLQLGCDNEDPLPHGANFRVSMTWQEPPLSILFCHRSGSCSPRLQPGAASLLSIRVKQQAQGTPSKRSSGPT